MYNPSLKRALSSVLRQHPPHCCQVAATRGKVILYGIRFDGVEQFQEVLALSHPVKSHNFQDIYCAQRDHSRQQ